MDRLSGDALNCASTTKVGVSKIAYVRVNNLLVHHILFSILPLEAIKVNRAHKWQAAIIPRTEKPTRPVSRPMTEQTM